MFKIKCHKYHVLYYLLVIIYIEFKINLYTEYVLHVDT